MTVARTHSPARLARLLAAPALVLALGAAGTACGTESTGAQVEGAWARTSPMDSANGAAYFSITSDIDDSLIGVSVDASVAARAELHETVMSGGDMSGGDMSGGDMSGGMDGAGTTMPMGEMTMQQVDSIELPAGTAVELEPGGYHVMLLELAEPLEVGDTITLTLALKNGGSVEVEVPVRDEAP